MDGLSVSREGMPGMAREDALSIALIAARRRSYTLDSAIKNVKSPLLQVEKRAGSAASKEEENYVQPLIVPSTISDGHHLPGLQALTATRHYAVAFFNFTDDLDKTTESDTGLNRDLLDRVVIIDSHDKDV